ncbi:MAG: 23S rRNA (adenine(2030)-N(6))-methyltransferase RlmJ [Proteobacteria bacterium]|jgi:23S rRNA (adenine2030-N6)-methyltransferase|nr:23S rRNA (adenine(2030)-N(6))-methyltransferase RlmJ [Pseudomonadota bacterium]
MLSYRHEFHAGSAADLLKHTVLTLVIEYLKLKPAAVRYIDTHAGAGIYDINSAEAEKTREFRRGVGRLPLDRLQDVLPGPLSSYTSLLKTCASDHQYPGSPMLAASLLRSQDELRLFELHTTEYPRLSQLFRRDRRVKVVNTDGYQSTTALLPVSHSRAVILIDPSYELKSDYEAVAEAVRRGYERMPNAVFMIWYPVVNNPLLPRMMRHLTEIPEGKLWRYELTLTNKTTQSGMTATGMLVINPPWTLERDLENAFKVLCPFLDYDDTHLTITCLKA